jgi:LysM repeat protein
MIQGGDTWDKISTSTGVPVQQLKQLNPSILEGSPLPAGQTIRVR